MALVLMMKLRMSGIILLVRRGDGLIPGCQGLIATGSSISSA